MTTNMSDDTPLALNELEPSPVEEDTPRERAQDSYFPPTQKATRKATHKHGSNLGLHDHSLIWWLQRIQRVTTFPLTAFAVLHITNTSLIPLATQSAEVADNYLLLTRPYYQSPPLEYLLLGVPAALHITSGLGLRLLRRRRALQSAGIDADSKSLTASLTASIKRRAWPRLSATSSLGLALIPILASHLAFTRFAPLRADVPNVGLSFVAHAVYRAPFSGTLGLAAVITLGVSHAVLGWSKWLSLNPANAAATTSGRQEDKRKAKNRRWWQIAAVTALVGAAWMAGGLGVVGRGGNAIGWQGREYDKVLNKVPILG